MSGTTASGQEVELGLPRHRKAATSPVQTQAGRAPSVKNGGFRTFATVADYEPKTKTPNFDRHRRGADMLR
jgi:hypothetical protein